MGDEFFTVSELNGLIKDVIRAGFPQTVWVCGEIQGYERNKNKNHIFFELVEKEPDSKGIIARIGLVIFAGKKAVIREILEKNDTPFSLKDDIEVKFECIVDFYAPHGALRLTVESIDPIYTLGRLAQERQRLIKHLKENGILDKNKQLTLSLVPLNIGLITSDDSAAYNDFLSELKKSGFSFRILLCNSLMQGKRAEKEICRALKKLNQIEFLDALVITRGGGSLADLSCFDSQMIAEGVAQSRLPVLSGIGHEINTTITDMAAHTFAKTPTAIAQFLIQTVQEFMDDLDEKFNKISEKAGYKLECEKQELKGFAFHLHQMTIRFLKEHNEKIIRLVEIVKHRPFVSLKDYRRILESEKETLRKALKVCVTSQHLKLKNYRKMIDIVHPRNTLKRGFSITRTRDGKILRKVFNIQVNELISTELQDGSLISQVQELKKVEFQKEEMG